MKRLIYTLCLIIGCATLSEAKVLTGHKTRLTDNWLYLRGDIGNIWEAVRPAAPGSSECVPLWTPVTLPHCFNATDAVDPDMNYYQVPGGIKHCSTYKIPIPTDESCSTLKERDKRPKYTSTRHGSLPISADTMNGRQISPKRCKHSSPLPNVFNVLAVKFPYPSVATTAGMRK